MPPSLPASRDYAATVLGILEDWRTARGALNKAAAAAGKSRVKPLPLARTKLLAPVRCSSAIYCGRRRQLCRSCRRNGPPHEPADGAQLYT